MMEIGFQERSRVCQWTAEPEFSMDSLAGILAPTPPPLWFPLIQHNPSPFLPLSTTISLDYNGRRKQLRLSLQGTACSAKSALQELIAWALGRSHWRLWCRQIVRFERGHVCLRFRVLTIPNFLRNRMFCKPLSGTSSERISNHLQCSRDSHVTSSISSQSRLLASNLRPGRLMSMARR